MCSLLALSPRPPSCLKAASTGSRDHRRDARFASGATAPSLSSALLHINLCRLASVGLASHRGTSIPRNTAICHRFTRWASQRGHAVRRHITAASRATLFVRNPQRVRLPGGDMPREIIPGPGSQSTHHDHRTGAKFEVAGDQQQDLEAPSVARVVVYLAGIMYAPEVHPNSALAPFSLVCAAPIGVKGKVTKKVVPFPSCDSNQSSPPCCSIRPREM